MTEQATPAYAPADYNAPTANEIRALLKTWGLTGAAAAAAIAANSRTMRRYTGGERDVSYPVLFTLAVKFSGHQVSPDNWRAELATDLAET